MRKAQAEYAQAQDELQLVQQREQQIGASLGEPYRRGAATQGRIFEAQERLNDATERVQDHQAELQRLTESRDARIRGGTAKTGGVFGTSFFPTTKNISDLDRKTDTPLGSSEAARDASKTLSVWSAQGKTASRCGREARGEWKLRRDSLHRRSRSGRD